MARFMQAVRTAFMAGSQEHSAHIALEILWKFRADSTPLSEEELKHLL